MHRFPYMARALLLGLITAQAVATLHVYLSNADLLHTLLLIKDGGYLVVPNQHIMDSLHEFRPALLGGLFFTLSIGAGLSVLTLAALWVWDRLVFRQRFILIPYFLLWAGCVVLVNRRGLSPLATLYFVAVPFVVAVAATKWMPVRSGKRVWLKGIAHFIPVIILGILWVPQMGGQMFINIRDNLLLTSPLGRKINNFYYDYNYYAAEVFRSLEQKILKTCNLKSIEKKSILRSVERDLLNKDYLPVEKKARVDLTVVQEGNILVFKDGKKVILRRPLASYFSEPGAVLGEFSSKSDKHTFFRQFTFFSILIGFPIALYIIVHGLLHLVVSLILDLFSNRTSPASHRPRVLEGAISSMLCFLLGMSLLVVFQLSGGARIEAKNLASALASNRWQERVAALKYIEQRGIDIGNFHAYTNIMATSHIPELYWFVRALGANRRSKAFNDLLSFLDNPHPNVVSMAFRALGQRGDKRAVKEILARIEKSEKWDNQWYAYRALRSLGWKQTKSR